MKLCVIAPISHLHLMNEGDMYFVLAQLAHMSDTYLEFIKKRPKDMYAIMDNGVYEKYAQKEEIIPDVDIILDLATEMKIDELVAIDEPFDSERTLESTKRFKKVVELAKDIKNTSNFKVMGVPHGSYLGDYLNCARHLSEIVDTLGISVLYHRQYYRDIALSQFHYYEELKDKELHILGLDNAHEILLLHELQVNIRSVDCSLPITLAKHHYCIHDTPVRMERVNLLGDDFDELIAKSNIQALKWWMR